MAKTLFHSELSKAGRVLIRLTSDVTASKFRGKPPFIGMILNGDARNYEVESDAIAATLRGRNGQTLLIEASGSTKDGTGAVAIYAAPAGAMVAENAAAGQQQAPPQQAPPPANNPPPANSAPPANNPPPAHEQAAAPAKQQTTDHIGALIEFKRTLCARGNSVALICDELLRQHEALFKRHGVPYDATMKAAAAEQLSQNLLEGETLRTLFISLDRQYRTGDDLPQGDLAPCLESARARLTKSQQH